MFRVAILVDTSNAYARGVIRGISQFIYENEPWDIFYEERGLDSPVPEWLKDWRGDGIIVRSMGPEPALSASKVCDKVIDLSVNSLPQLPTVRGSYRVAAKRVVEYYEKRQYQNFAYVGLRGEEYSEEQLKWCREFTGKDFPVFIMNRRDIASNGINSNTNLVEWLRTLPLPCAIFACYDLVGIHVIQACRKARLKVPEDIAVVGSNNDEIQCLLSPVPLSSLQSDTLKIGYETARTLLCWMEGAPPIHYCTLIPGLGIVTRRSSDSIALRDPLIKDAFRIVHQEACQGLTVQKLSERLQVSQRLLQRKFHTFLGRSVHEEILQVQMQRANELVQNTQLSLDAVARRVGFSNGSNLVVAYKKYFDKTPRKKDSNDISGESEYAF